MSECNIGDMAVQITFQPRAGAGSCAGERSRNDVSPCVGRHHYASQETYYFWHVRACLRTAYAGSPGRRGPGGLSCAGRGRGDRLAAAGAGSRRPHGRHWQAAVEDRPAGARWRSVGWAAGSPGMRVASVRMGISASDGGHENLVAVAWHPDVGWHASARAYLDQGGLAAFGRGGPAVAGRPAGRGVRGGAY